MKNFLAPIVLALLFFIPAYAHNPAIDSAHKTTHKIQIRALVSGGSKCSATAIAPHVLLTASHCEQPSAEILVDGNAFHIVAIERDGWDHTLLFLDATFVNVADFSRVPVATGDDIFLFGEPGPLSDILRKGYAANVPLPSLLPEATIYDVNGWFGDSGSAMFNEDGKIVGVLSVGFTDTDESGAWRVVGGYPLRFSERQLTRALLFVPPAFDFSSIFFSFGVNK